MDFKRPIRQLHIELTTTCNVRCPQCPRYDGDQDNPHLVQNELSLQDVRERLAWDFLIDLEHIYACGNFGDPAAAKQALEIFAYLRDCAPNALIGIHTNGSLRSPSWWRQLRDILGDRHYVVFSIDGLEDTNHIYRRGAAWSKIMANTEAFIHAGGNAQWSMLVFQHNEHQIEQARAYASELGFSKFTTKETRRKVPQSITWLKRVEPKQPLELSKKVDCLALRNEEIYLGADGKFYPCCYIGAVRYSSSHQQFEHFTDEQFKLLTYVPGLATCIKNCSVNEKGQVPYEQQFTREETL